MEASQSEAPTVRLIQNVRDTLQASVGTRGIFREVATLVSLHDIPHRTVR